MSYNSCIRLTNESPVRLVLFHLTVARVPRQIIVVEEWEGVLRERERDIYIFPWLQVRITGPRHT